MKRQQAAEDAIALHLAAAESGTTYEYLPPGRIYGMQVTSPEVEADADGVDVTVDSSATEMAAYSPPQAKNQDQSEEPSTSGEISVTPASIEMLTKLFPNKKRSVLELVLKRCNHDLLKAIEHFNINKKDIEVEIDMETIHTSNRQKSSGIIKPSSNVDVSRSSDSTSPIFKDGGLFKESAFKPVVQQTQFKSSLKGLHPSPISLMAGSKVFMHSLYPFLPLFNSQPTMLPSPVYVPGFCECEQCKHNLYRVEPRL